MGVRWSLLSSRWETTVGSYLVGTACQAQPLGLGRLSREARPTMPMCGWPPSHFWFCRVEWLSESSDGTDNTHSETFMGFCHCLSVWLLRVWLLASLIKQHRMAWRILGTGEPGGLPSVGSHRVGHDWSGSAAAECLGVVQLVGECAGIVGPRTAPATAEDGSGWDGPSQQRAWELLM